MSHLAQTERRILDEALDALGIQARTAAKVVRRTRGLFDPRFDAQIELELHGQKVLLLAEI